MSLKSIGRTAGGIALAASIALVTAVAPAAARAKIGVLTCRVSPGVGLIIGSSKRLACDFAPTGYRGEHYVGSINKIGVDLGFTTGGVIVWSVFAATSGYSHHALAGRYAGASAEASLVAGLGANVLLGGSGRSVALQPVSVQGNTGIDVAAGITGLTLYATR